MSTLHEKRDLLQAIPNNWLSNHNVPMHFQSCRGFLAKNRKAAYRLSIMGCIFQTSTTDFNSSDNVHVLDCAYCYCDAQIRVFNAGRYFDKTVISRETYIELIEVELLPSHECATVTYQATVLRYMDILRKHLLKNDTNKLTSHTGFYIFEEGVGARGTLNAPIAIYDHLFSWRARSKSNSSTHAYCNNGLCLTCGVNREKPCGLEKLATSQRPFTRPLADQIHMNASFLMRFKLWMNYARIPFTTSIKFMC